MGTHTGSPGVNRVLSITLVSGVALFFGGMGVVGLVTPEQILGSFGVASLPPDARNEVRAVYGGFGIAIALLLFLSLSGRSIGRGMVVAVAVALLGMAGGRIYSFLIEPTTGPNPATYLFLEVALAAALLGSLWLRART